MKMAAPMKTEIRKLRKKLRQIENLEILNRPLDQQEEAKIARKDEIREQLQELLVYHQELYDEPACEPDACGPTTVGNEYTSERNSEKIHYEGLQPAESESQSENSLISAKGSTTDQQKKAPGDINKMYEEKVASEEEQFSKDAESVKNVRKDWKKLKVLVTELEGHSDLVTSLSFAGNMIVTGSRDTTLKVWDLDTKDEVRSFGGHTEAVTSTLVLSPEESSFLAKDLGTSPTDHLVISGSTDCTVRTWSLDSGKMLQSVYTFNPVACVAYSYHVHKLVTASDGGKLELWDLRTAENVHSVQPHESSITGLKIVDSYVYSSCADGLLMVHEIRSNKFSRTFVSEDIKPTKRNGRITQRPVRCMEVAGSIILFGDDAFNIKLLDWRKGLVSKLPNHKTEFSSTDALCVYDSLLISSSYDLDNGLGYLNVRTYPGGDYLATLDDDDTRKIVCLNCARLQSGAVVVVTGGWQLKVWELLTSGSSGVSAETDEQPLATRYIARLSHPARDSEVESDVEEDVSEESDEEGNDRKEGGRRVSVDSTSEPRGWLAWCSVL